MFTALSVGRASSFAPDASKAKISAGRVLALLRRQPVIDSTCTDGQKPVSKMLYAHTHCLYMYIFFVSDLCFWCVGVYARCH